MEHGASCDSLLPWSPLSPPCSAILGPSPRSTADEAITLTEELGPQPWLSGEVLSLGHTFRGTHLSQTFIGLCPNFNIAFRRMSRRLLYKVSAPGEIATTKG
jgi:hypothetical protein